MGQKRYCICQSIAGLEQLIENGEDPRAWLSIDDRPATWCEIRAAIEDAKVKGYDVLPPCDNVNTTGHCMGHDIQDAEIVDQESPEPHRPGIERQRAT